MARAGPRMRQDADHGGDGGDAGLRAMTSSAPHAVLPEAPRTARVIRAVPPARGVADQGPSDTLPAQALACSACVLARQVRGAPWLPGRGPTKEGSRELERWSRFWLSLRMVRALRRGACPRARTWPTARRVSPSRGGEQGAEEAAQVLALPANPAHGQGPEKRGMPAREDMPHGVVRRPVEWGEQGPERQPRVWLSPRTIKTS